MKESEKLTFWRADEIVESKIRKDTCVAVYNSLLFPFTQGPHFPVMTLSSCTAEHGNSGSPLLNSKGEVVAILEGVNNEKNQDFFKEKFKEQKLANVIKSSNFACIALPNENKVLPIECSNPKNEKSFLTEGNEIIIQAAVKTLKKKNQKVAGLQFDQGVLFDANYNPEALRRDTFNSGSVPICLLSRTELLQHASDLPPSENQKYFKSLALDENKVCDIEFTFTDIMKVKKVSQTQCQKYSAMIAFSDKENKDGMPYYFVMMDKAGDIKSFSEGFLPDCQARK